MKPTTLAGLLAFGLGTAGDRGAGFFSSCFISIFEIIVDVSMSQ